MPHSQGLSNNSYPEPNQHNPSHWHPALRSVKSINVDFLNQIRRPIGLARLGEPSSRPNPHFEFWKCQKSNSRPHGQFLESLPVKILKALLASSILATWPAHLSLLDLISLTTLGEWYKQWSSSLWSLLHLPFASYMLISGSKKYNFKSLIVFCR